MTEEKQILSLLNRRVYRLTGPDTVTFLQGLVTIDVGKLETSGPRYGCLLSPQGKFLHDFFLFKQKDDIWLDIASDRAGDFFTRLSLYRLKRQVNWTEMSDISVASSLVTQEETGEELVGFPDPRLKALGARYYASEDKLRHLAERNGWVVGSDKAYHHSRISHAVPEGNEDLTPDKSLLLEYGFDALHAVDFSKGCYIGQEVTARTHYRANLRKGIYAVQPLEGQLTPHVPVMLADRQVGQLLSAEMERGIALLRMEAEKQAEQEGAPLKAGEVPIKVSIPEWVRKI